jgi:undecaprenyl diphosphate synthase
MQSALHVAIIMDGNGRWATRRGLPRSAGHREGAKAVRRIVRAAPRLGIRTLTLYAFSADNWKRPALEVGTLMRIFRAYLAAETATCVQSGVRLGIIGRRDRLPAPLLAAIANAEETTRGGEVLDLRIAVDYSAQEAIIGAAERAAAARQADGAALRREDFGRFIDQATHAGAPTPPVDLLIRTGGEQRLSDFLLWETTYAELYFTPAMWPDFQADDLRAALADFAARERRFGGLPAQAAS